MKRGLKIAIVGKLTKARSLVAASDLWMFAKSAGEVITISPGLVESPYNQRAMTISFEAFAEEASKHDVVVFQGGADIITNQIDGNAGEPDVYQEIVENTLFPRLHEIKGTKFLLICRSMQAYGVKVLKSTLVTHVEGFADEVKPVNYVNCVKSDIPKLLKSQFEVQCNNHQALMLSTTPGAMFTPLNNLNDKQPTGIHIATGKYKTKDGLIGPKAKKEMEGYVTELCFGYVDQNVVGVQFHPERKLLYSNGEVRWPKPFEFYLNLQLPNIE